MSEEVAEVVHHFVPGENLKLEVELSARSNLASIQAHFVKDKNTYEQRSLVLSSGDYGFIIRREGDVRFTSTTLTVEESHPILPGDYWLDSIHAITRRGKRRQIDPAARVCIRVHEEPREDTLTITNLTFP